MDCSPPGSSVHGILQARILALDESLILHECFYWSPWRLSLPLVKGFVGFAAKQDQNVHKYTSSTSSSLEGKIMQGVVADKSLAVRWYTCLRKICMCKYVFTCIFSARGNEGHRHLSLKRLYCQAFSFPSSIFHFTQWLLMEHTTLSPIMILGLWILVFISDCWLYAKIASCLELGRGSAYSSGRAQGNLYATRPAFPPLLAWA